MDFLLEIGLEDLPAGVIGPLARDAETEFSRLLLEYRLNPESIRVFTTIRRLTVHATGLPEKQADRVIEVAGPPAAKAFKPDGTLTPAGEGYCRAQRIKPADLQVRENDKKRVTFYRREEPGRTGQEILPEIARQTLEALSVGKMMRWGENAAPFIRPVTSLLCFLDKQALPLEFGGVKSASHTFGHPTLSAGEIEIDSIPGYFQALEKNHVILDQDKRKQKLVEQISGFLPAGASFSSANLAAASRTLEFPECALSRLDIAGVPYPLEVVANIVEGLKCLPLYGKDNQLLPEFVILADGRVTPEIKEGFHWVLESRMEDAGFFWQEDTRLPVQARRSNLGKIIFQNELGSLDAYSLRLTGLAAKFARNLNLQQAEIEDLQRAADLAKFDLTTSTVREFPDLAGIMGAALLKRDGLPESVCRPVAEHLLPRYPGDSLPESRLGQLLSFSDKVLHLSGLLVSGIEPSGSADPFGLRRLAQGLLEVAWKAGFRFPLKDTAEAALAAWEKTSGANPAAFLRQRIENILENQGFKPDIVGAALDAEGDSITAFPLRCEALAEFIKQPEGVSDITMFSRVTNIVTQAKSKGLAFAGFQPALLSEDAEKELASAWNGIKTEVYKLLAAENYRQGLAKIAELGPQVNRFFDKVMVMAENPEVRGNRLGLLSEISQALRRIGALNRIQT